MAVRAHRPAAATPAAGSTGDLFAPPAKPAAPTSAPRELPRREPARRQLWLALRFPELALRALARRRSAPAPLVIVAGEGAQRRVVTGNAAAAAAGIRAGLALAAAHVLAAELEVVTYDPLAEQRELEALARWALSFTSFVSLEPPTQLLLEVQGSLALFGGAAALIARIETELSAAGQVLAFALAPTARAASWFSVAAPGTVIDSAAALAGPLGRLPLAATGWSERTLEDATRLGLSTLAELKRLPRDGLARRFEPCVLRELDEAYAARAAPRRRHVVPERFLERLELPAELSGSAELAPYCTLLLERMQGFLRARAAGVTRIAFLFRHRERKSSCVVLGRALPASGSGEWQALLRERLQSVVLPAPVLALGLRTSGAVALSGASAALPGLDRRETEAFALLDRLRARLGEAAVSGLSLVPEHRPEAAYRAVRPEPRPPTTVTGEPAPLPPAPRPLWLLANPEPLGLRDGRPSYDGRLTLESGPERIESGWWNGTPVARDYYIALTRRGARLWIFRERGAGRWFVHGVFG